MVETSKTAKEKVKGLNNDGHILIKGAGFVNENTGNIKDFYKISSCIGRGKCPNWYKQAQTLLLQILKNFN